MIIILVFIVAVCVLQVIHFRKKSPYNYGAPFWYVDARTRMVIFRIWVLTLNSNNILVLIFTTNPVVKNIVWIGHNFFGGTLTCSKDSIPKYFPAHYLHQNDSS